MRALYFFCKWIIFLRNPFSNKKYAASFIDGRVVFIYRKNPEIVIHDYQNYVQSLLANSLADLKKCRLIFFECPGLNLLKLHPYYLQIYLQIEHTLLKPGFGNIVSTLPGALFLLNGQEKYLIRIAEFEKLNLADLVFDYSRINLMNIESTELLSNYRRKSFCISPSLYPVDTKMTGRSGTITLFGNLEIPRRKLFLEELRKSNIDSENIQGVYKGVERIYRKSRIVVNIRQTDSYDTLEELRILPALRSGAIVVCEHAPCVQKTRYSKYIIWGSLREMPSLIVNIERNYEEVHRTIFGDRTQNSAFFKRMKRIERCNVLSVKKAIQYLNSLPR